MYVCMGVVMFMTMSLYRPYVSDFFPPFGIRPTAATYPKRRNVLQEVCYCTHSAIVLSSKSEDPAVTPSPLSLP